MTRRRSKNVTGISRIEGIPYHDAGIGVIGLKCHSFNNIRIGKELLTPADADENAEWKGLNCKYVHSKDTDLPFDNWPDRFIVAESIQAQRFWEAFFRIITEHKESYWKQCNVCERVLPFSAFSKHSGWGPLERQM